MIESWIYVLALCGGAAVSWTMTPIARWLAMRLDAMDFPGGYKVQESPVPYLGGLAIVLGFAVSVAIGSALLPISNVSSELAAILGVGAFLAFVGLFDDLRGLSPGLRLLLQITASVVVWNAGVRVELSGVVWLDLVVTLVWVVGITNAFNLLDNMDGLAAGVSAIGAGAYGVIAAVNGQFLVGALAAGLAGCALGFLWHNSHPARIYMGDAGSTFLGFMLAVVGVKLAFDAPQTATIGVPIVVLGVAIFDTSLVVITRVRAGVSPLTGGRDHLSHRLVALGMSVPEAVRRIYLAALILATLGVVMPWLGPVLSLGILAMVLLVGVALGVRAASWPIGAADETSAS